MKHILIKHHKAEYKLRKLELKMESLDDDYSPFDKEDKLEKDSPRCPSPQYYMMNGRWNEKTI